MRILLKKVHKRLDFLRKLRYYQAMTPKEIDDWLRTIGKDRAWLAERLAVSVHTARGWFSGGRPIPKRKMERIIELSSAFNKNEHEKVLFNPNSLKVIGSVFSDEDAEKIKMAAEITGEPIEIFMQKATLEAMRRILGEE